MVKLKILAKHSKLGKKWKKLAKIIKIATALFKKKGLYDQSFILENIDFIFLGGLKTFQTLF